MPAQLVSIAHLLLAIALLQLGSGLQGLLIPVRGQIAGFPTYAIGLLGTASPGKEASVPTAPGTTQR